MTVYHLKFSILFFIISVSFPSFSQKGTYQLVSNPSDAPRSPNEEFPISLDKVQLELRGSGKLKVTRTDLDDKNQQIYYGSWSLEANRIKLELPDLTPPLTVLYETVILKSGIYIKPENDYFHYYRKQ